MINLLYKMNNQSKELEQKVEDYASLDYEEPILLRHEYQGLPVRGNFDLQIADVILRRQLGIIRKIKSEEFERIKQVLEYTPKKDELTDRFRYFEAHIYSPTKYEQFYPWITLQVTKSFESLKERGRYRTLKREFPEVKLGIKAEAFISTKKPCKREVLGIPIDFNNTYLNQYPQNIEMGFVIDRPDYAVLICSQINLDAVPLKV